MVTFTPYLSVRNALEAIELYQQIFNAELVERMPVGKEQAPSLGVPEEADLDKMTMHSTLKIGEASFFMSDNFTGEVLEKQNMAILITPDSLEQAEFFFKNAEEAGCQISMKFEKQFWGDYFGSFVDPFGISWQINYTPMET